MFFSIISLVFCLKTCLAKSIINPIDFGIRLADGIHEKFKNNQYRIPQANQQLEAGTLRSSVGVFTSLDIAFKDIVLFPDKEEMRFTFTSNKTVVRQPFEIVGEEKINGTVTVVINQLLIKITYDIYSDPKKGRCVVRAKQVDHELPDADGAVTSMYQLFGSDKMADDKKKRLGSELDSYVQSNLLPTIQKELNHNLELGGRDAILDVTLNTFGGNGYKGCKKYILNLVSGD